jgi:phosphatidylglycerophosphatase A
MNKPADQPVAASAPSPGARRTLWAWAIATFFGAGFWKPGPGTAGSVAATLIWWCAGHWARIAPAATGVLSARELALLTGAAALLLLAVAIPAATIVARESGRKDPQIVVADEVVGQWITLIGAPSNWAFALIGLILFRLFDIAKPSPVRELEHLPEGWGVMLDDVGAGIYAAVVLQIVSHFVR